MNQRTSRSDFVELASLKLVGPLALFVFVALFNWGTALALGFALGVLGGGVGSYFSWLHFNQLAQQTENKSPSQVQRAAWGGTLASVALMATVLAVAAYAPWLDVLACAVGLLLPKLLIGLSPFLRRTSWRR